MVKKVTVLFITVFLSMLFIGCKSTEHADIGNIRESSTFILGELEASVQAFDRGVERALERSKNITDEVVRLDYLFGEYERAALQLREDYRKAKAELEKIQNIYDSSDSDSIVDDSRSSSNDNTKS